MIRTQPRSVLNWSACAALIGDTGMVDLLDEVMMQENELRDRVQLLVETANAQRQLAQALREAEARRGAGMVGEPDAEQEQAIADSRALLDTIEQRLLRLTGRTDQHTAHVVARAATQFLNEYDERLAESERELAERFCDQASTLVDASAAARDLHELLDLAVEARADALKPLNALLVTCRPAPVVVDSGRQLQLVH